MAWSSYRTTLGQAPVPDWLRTDEILSHFGSKPSFAQEKYQEYVREGIGAPTIWEDLKGAEHFGDQRIVAQHLDLTLLDDKPTDQGLSTARIKT